MEPGGQPDALSSGTGQEAGARGRTAPAALATPSPANHEPGTPEPAPLGGEEARAHALRRVTPLVLLVVAASALLAIAANGIRLIPPAIPLGGRWTWVVRIAGAAAVGAGVLGLLRQRSSLKAEDERGPDPTAVALQTAACAMGLLAVAALLFAPRQSPPEEVSPGRTATSSVPAPDSGAADTRPGTQLPLMGSGGAGGRGGSRPSGGGGVPSTLSPTQPGTMASGSLLQRLSRILVFLVLLASVMIGFLILTGRLKFGRGNQPPDEEIEPSLGEEEEDSEPEVAPADAEAGLEASLAAMDAARGDPRRQITAAYYRLLLALAASGAPRQPQEAPHEHLDRALGPLGIRSESLHLLAGLYVLAQFSERPVTDRHRTAAVEALKLSLSSLRASQGSLTTAGRTEGIPKVASA